MKITKEQLKHIIKEELTAVIKEWGSGEGYESSGSGYETPTSRKAWAATVQDRKSTAARHAAGPTRAEALYLHKWAGSAMGGSHREKDVGGMFRSFDDIYRTSRHDRPLLSAELDYQKEHRRGKTFESKEEIKRTLEGIISKFGLENSTPLMDVIKKVRSV